MNHQIGRWVFAIGVGLIVAFLSYRWITDPAPRAERLMQDAAVSSARTHINFHIENIVEFVDPHSPDRAVGKTYVFRTDNGWEVSGYYRRDNNDEWHPFLMSLDKDNAMTGLKVQDAALEGNTNPLIEILP